VSPPKLLRELCQGTQLPCTMCQRAAKKVKLHYCYVFLVHELRLVYKIYLLFCVCFQQYLRILHLMWFTDGALFHLCGYMSSQTTLMLMLESPYAVCEEPLHCVKIGSCCSVNQTSIIGPIFFHSTSATQRFTLQFSAFIYQLTDEAVAPG
jgi:hypothetical protein